MRGQRNDHGDDRGVGRFSDRYGRFAHLPVLDEVPELAALVSRLAAIDAAQAAVVSLVRRFDGTGEVEAATGVPLELWLLAAGMTASDRRMVHTAAAQLDRLPEVADGFDRGALSWAQVRAICLIVQRLPDPVAARIDAVLGGELDGLVGCDPDQVVHLVRQAATGLAPADEVDTVETAERSSFVSFQPRLDGTGAKVYGDLDGLGYGIVAAALDAGCPPPGRLRDRLGERTDPDRRHAAAVSAGRHRADRLVRLAADDLARTASLGTTTTDDESDDAGAGRDTGGPVDTTRSITPAVTLLLTWDQLTGHDPLPAELITHVTGGRLKVSTATARRLIDQAGARLRTLVLDDTGQALGVGRTRRLAPGWIRDTLDALEATCTAPGCRTATRRCDIDHHTPWHPTRPGDPPGTTDLDNLGPLCPTDNHAKQRDGWQVARDPDGRRHWHHPRTGLHLTTLPTTSHLDLHGHDPPDHPDPDADPPPRDLPWHGPPPPPPPPPDHPPDPDEVRDHPAA